MASSYVTFTTLGVYALCSRCAAWVSTLTQSSNKDEWLCADCLGGLVQPSRQTWLEELGE